MNIIEKTTTIYQALDGTEFDTEAKCKNYEITLTKEQILNLKHFEIELPLADWEDRFIAYRVMSENEFNMLCTYYENDSNPYDEIYMDYKGNGWYLIRTGNCFTESYKLKDIIDDFAQLLSKIAKEVLNFDVGDE